MAKRLNMFNPNLPLTAIESLHTHLIAWEMQCVGVSTIGALMQKTDKELLAIPGIGKGAVAKLRKAIADEKFITYCISNMLIHDGYRTEQAVLNMTVAQILDLFDGDISCAKIGRIIRFQRDMGSRHYDHQELVHTTIDGRVYHCDHCSYRNPDANYCGFCMQKIKDDLEIRRTMKGG